MVSASVSCPKVLVFPGSEADVEQTVREALTTLESSGVQLTSVSVPLHEKAMLALLPIFFEGGKHMFDTNLGGTFAKTYYPSSMISTFGRFKQSHGHALPLNYKLNLLVGDYLTRFTHGRLYAKAQKRPGRRLLNSTMKPWPKLMS